MSAKGSAGTGANIPLPYPSAIPCARPSGHLSIPVYKVLYNNVWCAEWRGSIIILGRLEISSSTCIFNFLLPVNSRSVSFFIFTFVYSTVFLFSTYDPHPLLIDLVDIERGFFFEHIYVACNKTGALEAIAKNYMRRYYTCNFQLCMMNNKIAQSVVK